VTKHKNKKTLERERKRREREPWLQAERDATLIEAGNFICPFCQKYVNPLEWWAFIEYNPYDEYRPYRPTLFHRGCSAPVPDRNKKWVKAMREFFRDTPVKPGDYVQLHDVRPWRKYATRPRRVVDVDDQWVDEGGDLVYTIDTSDIEPDEEYGYLPTREDFDVVPRPYLKTTADT
jgi:hypothetical protein